MIRQEYLPQGYCWGGRGIEVAAVCRPAMLAFLHAHPYLRAFSGLRPDAGGDHSCGGALDMVPLTQDARGKAALDRAHGDAVRSRKFPYVEPVVWEPDNKHLHISFVRCASFERRGPALAALSQLRQSRVFGLAPKGDKALIAKMAAHGIDYPADTLWAARATKLPLHYACAMLEKETGGGRNEFGHDPTTSIPTSWMGGAVNFVRYRYYKARRATHGMQGVGGTQLTWYAFQDRADAAGGCWIPRNNFLVGFSVLRANIARYGEQGGAAAYNGTGPAAAAYGHDFVVKAAHWKLVLS